MTLSHRISIAAFALLAALGITLGAAWLGYQNAGADGAGIMVGESTAFLPRAPGTHEVAVTAADGDTYTVASATEVKVNGRPVLLAQADTAGSAQPAPATVAPIASPLDELAALKAKYDALKAAKDSGSKDLLWFAYAALAAAALRVLLAGINAYRGDKPKTWAKWTALGLAVPIALLTYYGAGAGLWAAIVMAGSGPGAIIVNELLKRKASASS